MAVALELKDEGTGVCSLAIEEHGVPAIQEMMCDDRSVVQKLNIMGSKGTVWLAPEGIPLGEHSTMNNLSFWLKRYRSDNGKNWNDRLWRKDMYEDQMVLQQSLHNAQDIGPFLRANTAIMQILLPYARRGQRRAMSEILEIIKRLIPPVVKQLEYISEHFIQRIIETVDLVHFGRQLGRWRRCACPRLTGTRSAG